MNKFVALLGLLLLLICSNSKAQPCTAGFTYNIGANGLVFFGSTSAGSGTLNTYSWNFGNGQTYSATGSAGAFTSHQYTANGTYVVNLFFVTSPPTCSSSTQQTITVSTVTPCNVNANFSVTQFSNGTVGFYSSTTGTTSSTSYTWSFGNGFANTQNALHTYSVNGTYTVMLAVANNPTCTSTKTMVITVSSNPCLAAFGHTVLANGQVKFASTSIPADTSTIYYWTYGNGGTHADTGNVIATTVYTANGTYSVTLLITNGTCTASVTKTISVTTACTLLAGISYTLSSGATVLFSSASTGTNQFTVYRWRFGDGDSSAVRDPVHTYSAIGAYTVALKVINVSGCQHSVSVVVSVIPTCSLSASFAHTVGTGGNTTFSNTSAGVSGTSSATWFFGDGSSGNGQSPFHTYSNGGAHLVTLIVASGACIDTAQMSVNITGIGCTANSGFSVVPTATAHYWNAIPYYPWNVTAARWSWGDGSFSDSLYTSHQYSLSATYSICLSVTVSCGSSASTCASYFIYRSTAANTIYHVNVIPPAQVAVEIAEEANALSGRIYPNPTSGLLHIEAETFAGASPRFVLYNIQGELVHEARLAVDNYPLVADVDLQGLPAGLYLAELDVNGRFIRERIVLIR